MRAMQMVLCVIAPATALLGASPQTSGVRLEPPISFSLEDDVPVDLDDEGWRSLAKKVAGLQQLQCSEDLLGATTQMVDAAESGDSLAMAALGAMCTPLPCTACPCCRYMHPR
jgi:hypothetical protein